MKQNRRIPYGYCFLDAGIGISETEASVVRQIFTMYNEGKTLKHITDWLNETGIPYHESNPIWNKSMVYRIITNRKYLGDNTYPRTIADSVFATTTQQAEGRKKFRAPACPAEKVVHNKIFCACGARLVRNDTGHWECTSCKHSAISGKMLMELLCEAFDQISQDPSIILVEPKEDEYTPSVDIMKLNNDICRRLDAKDSNAEEIKADILKVALMKYESFEEDLTPYISRTICEEFEQSKSIESACIPLIEKTVASITLAQPTRIQIKLRNSALITAGRR